MIGKYISPAARGAYALRQIGKHVRFSQEHIRIDTNEFGTLTTECGTEERYNLYLALEENDQFPEGPFLIDLAINLEPNDGNGSENPYHLVNWLQYFDEHGQARLIVSDTAIYLCDDMGNTIESIR